MPKHDLQKWKSLFDSSPSAMVIADLNRNITDANRSFCRIFGYGQEEAQQLQVSTLYAERSEFERLRDVLDETHNAEGTSLYATYRRKNGQVFPGQVSLMILKDAEDETIGVAGIINDLSGSISNDLQLYLEAERSKAEDSRQKALYLRSPAIMHSINDAGRIETVSDAWLTRFGYSETDVIGKPSADFLTQESRIFATDVVLPEFWKTGTCKRVPYTFVCKDGTPVEVELSAVLDRSQEKPVTLAVLEDVTERNHSRRELEQRNQDLRDFAHIAAHDLQTPIRHISLFTDIMRSDMKAGVLDTLDDDLRVVEESARSLSRLINSLLDFSVAGGATLDQRRHDTNLLLENAKRMLAVEIAEAEATIEASDLPDLICDRSLMLRVLINLLANSLKYVEAGVTPLVRISGYSSNRETVLQVIDNGIGIPEAFRERVFQPLKRLHSADSEYTGTGIGLALCKRIVEAHRGSIKVGDAGPEGTLIELRLPN